MPTQIFVSLPVRNLQNSIRFYESLGYQKNPQFSDDTVAGFDVSDLIHVMLVTHDKFSELTPKQIADPGTLCHSLLSLSCDRREDVDTIVSKAIAAGGSEAHEPEDHGFMYQYRFYDLDGHGWGVFWRDPAIARQDVQ
jgi:predicted lactoylglutathione lyase